MAGAAHYDYQRLGDLLRRQNLVLGRDQALDCGLSPAALIHRLRPGGPWQKLLLGVYLTRTGPASAEQREMAALLHAGPRSVLTGTAAARRYGFQVPEAGPVDMVATCGRQVPWYGLRADSAEHANADGRVRRRGSPVRNVG